MMVGKDDPFPPGTRPAYFFLGPQLVQVPEPETVPEAHGGREGFSLQKGASVIGYDQLSSFFETKNWWVL